MNLQSACLKSRVKGTKDINCLPTSTGLRGWGREADKYFTCRGNLTNSRMETENGLSPNKSCCCARRGAALCLFPSGSGGLQEPRPPCCPMTAGILLLTNLQQVQKDMAPLPREGAHGQASPMHTTRHTDAQTGPSPCSSGAESRLLREWQAEAWVRAAPKQTAGWLLEPFLEHSAQAERRPLWELRTACLRLPHSGLDHLPGSGAKSL